MTIQQWGDLVVIASALLAFGGMCVGVVMVARDWWLARGQKSKRNPIENFAYAVHNSGMQRQFLRGIAVGYFLFALAAIIVGLEHGSFIPVVVGGVALFAGAFVAWVKWDGPVDG